MPRRWLHPRDNQSTFQLIEAFRTLSGPASSKLIKPREPTQTKSFSLAKICLSVCLDVWRIICSCVLLEMKPVCPVWSCPANKAGTRGFSTCDNLPFGGSAECFLEVSSFKRLSPTIFFSFHVVCLLERGCFCNVVQRCTRRYSALTTCAGSRLRTVTSDRSRFLFELVGMMSHG